MRIIEIPGIKCVFFKNISSKRTARCPEQCIVRDDYGNKYLIVFAATPIQIFYAKRAIEKQSEYEDVVDNSLMINKPIYQNRFPDGFYVVYPYFDKAKSVSDSFQIEYLKNYYDTCGLIGIDETERLKILTEYLSCWPRCYHDSIKKLPEYTTFYRELKKIKEARICFQHGDYAVNNVLSVRDYSLLVDFEFSVNYQPIGFDMYEYQVSCGHQSFDEIPNHELNKSKYKLQCAVNDILDEEYYGKALNILDFDNHDELSNVLKSCNTSGLKKYQNGIYKQIIIQYGGDIYKIIYCINGNVAIPVVSYLQIPMAVLECVIDEIFSSEKKVFLIRIIDALVNFKDMLKATVKNLPCELASMLEHIYDKENCMNSMANIPGKYIVFNGALNRINTNKNILKYRRTLKKYYKKVIGHN